MDKITQILNYLRGELAPQQLKDFEDNMQADSELAQEVDFLRDMQLAYEMYSTGGVSEKLENTWQKMQAKQSVQSQSTPRFSFSGYAANIAFILALGITVILVVIFVFYPYYSFLRNADTYKQTVIKVKEKYQTQHIALLDQEIALQNHHRGGAMEYPKLDTVLSAEKEVLFQWKNVAQHTKMNLEIFNAQTPDKNLTYSVHFQRHHYEVKLNQGLYYWQLTNEEGERVGIGRFYVVAQE
jgi:hypothetical protein